MSRSGFVRFVAGLAIAAVGLGGCTGPGNADGLLFVPFYVAFVVGLIGAAAIIAVGFSRPGSMLRRLGYVVLAFGLWILLAIGGFWYVLITHPMV